MWFYAGIYDNRNANTGYLLWLWLNFERKKLVFDQNIGILIRSEPNDGFLPPNSSKSIKSLKHFDSMLLSYGIAHLVFHTSVKSEWQISIQLIAFWRTHNNLSDFLDRYDKSNVSKKTRFLFICDSNCMPATWTVLEDPSIRKEWIFFFCYIP